MDLGRLGRGRDRLRAGRDWVDDVARESPARMALLVFFSIILTVTGLLLLPIAKAGPGGAAVVDAVFTATSAVAVTGLVTVDTATYWSTFGQGVILVAIKVGGLGIMTLASILGLAVSRRIGLTQRMLTASETGTTALGEVGTLVRAVLVASLTVEGLLAVVLLPRFLLLGESAGTALWHAVFMALSIFNNAGFVILPDGLAPFVGDWWMGLTIVVGTAVGAVGFPVILELSRRWRTPRRWSLHTKLTLVTYTVLATGTAVVIGFLEWTNPGTVGDHPADVKVLNALVAAVNSRSSGLSLVDVGQMREASWFLQDALMFVGGGSASTAGGIKVTTFAVLVLAILAEARGDRDLEAFGRRVGSSTVRLAVSVAFLGAMLVGVATLLLLTLTDFHLDVVLFEVISAFGTVGLSTGLSGELPTAGKYVLSTLMFAGRTGTITLAAALAMRERRRVIRYPDERPIIG